MDRITRALSLAEDSSVRLKMLESRAANFATVSVLSGTASNGKTDFGTLSVRSGAVAIVSFSGSTGQLVFDGKTVGSGQSPIVASLGAGRGALELVGGSGASAVVIGGL